MKNFVVCGCRESQKKKLAEEIIRRSKRNVYGFFTEKFPERAEDGFCPIYIYPAGGEVIFDEDHLVGLGGGGTHYINSEVFDGLGTALISCGDSNGLIIMCELGFLETEAKGFQDKVFSCLAGEIPTVVIMKQKLQYEFMQKLRDLEGVEYAELRSDNFDEILERVVKAFDEK